MPNEQRSPRPHRVAVLGTGLIGDFYTRALTGYSTPARAHVVYSRSAERAGAFARQWDIPVHTTDLTEAITHPDVDTVVVGLPNHLHESVVGLAVDAGKAVLCTKPLGRTAAEAERILEKVEAGGVFGGYLEDLCYTPKTLKALEAVRSGAIGDVLWTRSRETHPGPHSAWFWDAELAGGGAIVDLACHCIEIARCFVGKENRPLEVMCWADTLVHPIDAEDHAIGLIRFASGAVGQFEVSWGFRGGMDLRDEVAGVEGTIWTNHSLRTGLEMFTSGQGTGYVAEKAESTSGWLFPVADEIDEYGYRTMFADMFEAMDTGRAPAETLYDGYVVNAIMDACYRSAKSKSWEPVRLEWRGGEAPRVRRQAVTRDGKTVIKEETLPDGRVRAILKDPATGRYEDQILSSSLIPADGRASPDRRQIEEAP